MTRPPAAGFHDAHTHLSAGAADLHALDLRTTHPAAARTDPRGWIRGWGWDGVTPPIDTAPETPTFLARRDGHAGWLNAAASRALGRDPQAAVVAEEAFDEVRRRLPERTPEERIAALRPRLAELHGLGVSKVDDMVEPWGPEVYARLADHGELPVAIRMWLPESLAEADAETLRRAYPESAPRLAVAGIKVFLDGSLAARTAALSRPYADAPETAGELRIPEREIGDRVARWAQRGFAVAVHAIGDRAVGLALDAFERAGRPRAGAHRIEHAQVVQWSDLPRFAALHVVASVQPGHWRDDRGFTPQRLGGRTDVVAHPLRSLARSGAHLVFGSDWPVSSWDPEGVLAAATDPSRGEEALDPASAAAWYTSGPR